MTYQCPEVVGLDFFFLKGERFIRLFLLPTDTATVWLLLLTLFFPISRYRYFIPSTPHPTPRPASKLISTNADFLLLLALANSIKKEEKRKEKRGGGGETQLSKSEICCAAFKMAFNYNAK